MKKRYYWAAAVCAAACVLCLILYSSHFRQDTTAHSFPTLAPTPMVTSTVSNDPAATPGAADEYVSLVDFEQLKATNEDIYAWLDIPGTDISYPIVQNAVDDTLYLDHGSDGAYASEGALFTEHAYNSMDFEDPVTIIYGHHMRSGSMFGSLQALYSDAATFESINEWIVYLPDRELRYRVFAAIPFDGYHILYNFDFTNARTYEAFFDRIMAIRALGANFNPENQPTSEDKVLILSTCLQGNSSRRYLVMATLVQ